ncbi:MAG: ribonuclease III [Lachnospiraceae bacterium]|nr:ribonuclease III [Lachnospiraceae bacterium]
MLLEKIKQEFGCPAQDIRTYSPLTLAFMGDAVFDMVIRTLLVQRANKDNHLLHKENSHIVRAKTQAQMAEVLWEMLSGEEQAVYRRGRNAKTATSAKNASLAEYHKATGMEALLGYLYLTDREDRVLYLIREGLAKLNLTI